MNRYFFSALCVLLLQACTSETIFQQKYKLDHHSWKTEQVLVFNWDIKDTTLLFDIELEIDHDADFRFQNQYIKAKTKFPDSTTKEQILSLELFDDTGRPYGNCVSSTCKTPILLQSRIKFQKSGTYQLQLSQNGREPESPGIHAVQLKILKSKV
ncbi:MAG: gliding motility lipoprotein GldH [Saprospiraceae bacterium]|nr:gliding motility lipoprotein GldH [Saprospiraceae bacterium]